MSEEPDEHYYFQVFEHLDDYSEETPYFVFYVEFESSGNFPLFQYTPDTGSWWFTEDQLVSNEVSPPREPSSEFESILERLTENEKVAHYIYVLDPPEMVEYPTADEFELDSLPPYEAFLIEELLRTLTDERHLPDEMCLYLQSIFERTYKPPREERRV